MNLVGLSNVPKGDPKEGTQAKVEEDEGDKGGDYPKPPLPGEDVTDGEDGREKAYECCPNSN